MSELRLERHGEAPWRVIAIHGGPAAAGDLAPLAAELGRRFGTLEPHQRGSSDTPLSVAVHIEDLRAVIESHCDAPPILLGHSWGAMLALAFAAEHPSSAAALLLVGCGTFSPGARKIFEERRAAQTTPEIAAALNRVSAIEPADVRFAEYGALMNQIYGFDLIETPAPGGPFDHRAHGESWSDMVRLQESGVYPAAFRDITVPTLMMHGDHDPHPGPETFRDLQAVIPHLEYQQLSDCGHSPWFERQARDHFFSRCEQWILARGG